jgi:Fe-S oxidoreductase/nitrate reductase gamma subunit
MIITNIEMENNLIASREILWNVSSTSNVVFMYLVFALSMVIFSWGIWARVRLWARGVPAKDRLNNLTNRFSSFLSDVLLQKRVNKQKNAKIFHSLILWGFVVLLFTTTMVFIDHDLGIKIYKGRFYLAVTILSDLFGLALLFGIVYAYYLRSIVKPDRLNTAFGDHLMLASLAIMSVQGFILEALRIKATNDPWAFYSPVGLLVSKFFWALDLNSLRTLHFAIWWLHALTVFAFIAFLPYTKFLHIFTSSANLFFRENTRAKGALPHPGDLEKIIAGLTDSSQEFKIGISSIEDLSWKQLLDLDACTSCGRCQEVCPAYNSGKMLSPKWLILDSKNHLLKLHGHDKFFKTKESNSITSMLDSADRFLTRELSLTNSTSDSPKSANPLVQNALIDAGSSSQSLLAGEVINEDVFWSCTTCRACMEVCPVGIEHVDYIVEARRSLVLLQGKIPSEAQSSLRAIETRGNPFGPAESRIDWAKELNAKVLQPGDEVEILYWVGCVSAYDKRKQKIAQAMVKILNSSGMSWGVLGNLEQCSGDPARRLGEENLFQISAKNNVTNIRSVKFKTMVANCPHCFNTLKNEYPVFDRLQEHDFEILHHTELIHRFISEGKIKISPDYSKKITFHDPCYLGRYNDQYSAPREILVQLGGNNSLKEMEQSGAKAMCCGAGGGHYWFDMKVGTRINTARIEQVAETDADTVATGCPFCMQMLEDGIKSTNREDSLRVKDVAELVVEGLI